MSRTKNSILKIAAALALAVLVSAGAASPATAKTLGTQGLPGPYTTSPVDCRYSNLRTSGVLQMTVRPPTVWARNLNAGWGNDASYVRYAVFVKDARTGAMLDATAYSGWALAYDNQPASYTGNAAFRQDWRGQYVVEYVIEWWVSGGRALIGAVADRSEAYRYVNQYNVPRGGLFSSCTKVM